MTTIWRPITNSFHSLGVDRYEYQLDREQARILYRSVTEMARTHGWKIGLKHTRVVYCADWEIHVDLASPESTPTHYQTLTRALGVMGDFHVLDQKKIEQRCPYSLKEIDYDEERIECWIECWVEGWVESRESAPYTIRFVLCAPMSTDDGASAELELSERFRAAWKNEAQFEFTYQIEHTNPATSVLELPELIRSALESKSDAETSSHLLPSSHESPGSLSDSL